MKSKLSPKPGLQVLEQVDDLRLDRDVERGDRLVADDELRLDRKRARDADALALAAGELVRIAPRVAGAQADEARGARRPAPRAPCRGQAVDARAARPAISADRHARVERREGVLEDDLHRARARPRIVAVRAARGCRCPRSGPARRRARAGAAPAGPWSICRSRDSPTSASVSPAASGEVDAVDGACTVPRRAAERGRDASREVLDEALAPRGAGRALMARNSGCATCDHHAPSERRLDGKRATCRACEPRGAAARSLRQRSTAKGQRGWKRAAVAAVRAGSAPCPRWWRAAPCSTCELAASEPRSPIV